jgi:hypothetical protein
MNYSLYIAGQLTKERQRRLLDEAAAARRADAATGTRPGISAVIAHVVGQLETRVGSERQERSWIEGGMTAPVLRPEAA